jgi:hypothetical protein
MIGFIGAFFTIALNCNQLQQLTINDCLRLAPFCWTATVFSCKLLCSCLQITHFWFTNELWMSNDDSSTIDCVLTCPPFITSGGRNRSHHVQQFLYYCVLIRCCGNVPRDPILSSGRPSTVESVTSGARLLSRCLAMVKCITIYLHVYMIIHVHTWRWSTTIETCGVLI